MSDNTKNRKSTIKRIAGNLLSNVFSELSESDHERFVRVAVRIAVEIDRQVERLPTLYGESERYDFCHCDHQRGDHHKFRGDCFMKDCDCHSFVLREQA